MPAEDQFCQPCKFKDDCIFTPCPAYTTLHKVYKAESTKRKEILIKQLRKDLNIYDSEPSKDMKKLADKIISKFNELHFINDYEIKIGYVMCYERPQGPKIKYADCRKVHIVYQAYLPFDFIITFYEPNTSMLNDNQLKLLMYHELRHIGIGKDGYKIELHEVEDFYSILKDYGIDWNGFDQIVPDILAGDKNG